MKAFRLFWNEDGDVSNPMPQASLELTPTAAPFKSRWAICLGPAARACLCSLFGHGALLVVLAMSFAAVTGGSSNGVSLVAGVSDSAEMDDFAELELQTEELPPTPACLAVGTFDAESMTVTVADFGQPVKGVAEGAPLTSGDLLDSLPADLAARAESAKRLKKSANFYGIEANGNDFVFVVDLSGSMHGSRFRRARGEVSRSIQSLEAPQRYFVIFFSDQEWPMPARDLLEATEQNLNSTRHWLKKAQCQGGTNPLPALLHALDLRPDAIFLLSDGRFDPEAALQIQQAQLSPPIPIHTIGFASRAGEPMLRAISDACGGTYRFVR